MIIAPNEILLRQTQLAFAYEFKLCQVPFGSSSFNHLVSTGFYNGVATQSLRSDRPSGSRLVKVWHAC